MADPEIPEADLPDAGGGVLGAERAAISGSISGVLVTSMVCMLMPGRDLACLGLARERIRRRLWTVTLSRRFAGFLGVLGAVAVAVAVVVACSSSSAGDGGSGNDAGNAGSDGGSPDSGNPGDDDGDAGFTTNADAGCPLEFQGPKSGSVAASVPRAGSTSVAWSDPEKALTVDGMFAHVMLDVDQASEHLRVTGYGFSIPEAASIKGVVVELKRQGNNQIVDGNIELWLDGVPSSRPKYVASGWPVAIGTHHYGQEIDTWGDDLSPELVGRAGFGTEIYALRREDAGTGAVEGDVESLLITIWYCQ
jgi:hypothetical protein